MTEHPSLIPQAVKKAERTIIIKEERVPKIYEAYRKTVLDLLDQTRTNFLDLEKANSIEEIREILNNSEVQFSHLQEDLERLLGFLDKLVANAELERAVLLKLDRELGK